MENFKKLPRHVAIIMDGNGRWAKERHLPRIEGHRRGVQAIETVVTTASELGIPYLTLYAFSKENWARPKAEVDFLMNLLAEYLDSQLEKLKKHEMRFGVIGCIEDLPKRVQEKITRNINETKGHTKFNLTLALSYSGRHEIVEAAKHLARKVLAGELTSEKITETEFAQALDTAYLPDPDLLIRTSGEFRVSNFLLWQISYTELLMSEKYWPDFTREDFLLAIREFEKRERRFGRTETGCDNFDAALQSRAS